MEIHVVSLVAASSPTPVTWGGEWKWPAKDTVNGICLVESTCEGQLFLLAHVNQSLEGRPFPAISPS